MQVLGNDNNFTEQHILQLNRREVERSARSKQPTPPVTDKLIISVMYESL